MFSGCSGLEEAVLSDTILCALSHVMRPGGKTARFWSETEPECVYGAQAYACSDPYKYVDEPEMKPVPMGSISESERRACLGLNAGVKLTIVPTGKAEVCERKKAERREESELRIPEKGKGEFAEPADAGQSPDPVSRTVRQGFFSLTNGSGR